MIFVCGIKAQTKASLVTTTTYGNTLDTVVNTASKVTTPLIIGAWKLGVTAQVIVTKISGTVGGSIGLYGSMDGTNFNLIGSASTPSDASANYSFNTTAAWKYYQVKYTGTGTMSASMKTYIMPY
jgi:hypothetical protein